MTGPIHVGLDSAADPSRSPDAEEPTSRVAVGHARRARRRRITGWTMVTVGAAVLLGVGWLGFSGWRAETELVAARACEVQLRAALDSGDPPAAVLAAQQFSDHAQRARSWVGGPVWAVTAALPGSGPVATVRAIGRGAGGLADTVPALVSVLDQLQSGTVRRSDGSLDTAGLTASAAGLRTAAAAVRAARTEVADTPERTWVGAVDRARSEFLGDLDTVSGPLQSAADAAGIAAPLLGASGPRRYFVAFQNDAEARGTGGLTGQFAILSIDAGRPTFVHFGSDAELDEVSSGLQMDADQQQLYAAYRSPEVFLNGNVSPDFPTAARLWTAMWTVHSGERLDGAIALDPTALSYLLAVTGPAGLPDGTAVAADTVVPLTESDAYARFGNDRAARQRYLAAVAQAVVTKLVSYRGSARTLIRAAAQAADERRLLVWSADPGLQKAIAGTAVSGVLPDTPEPFAGFTVVNDGGDKLDYYLDRSMTWERTDCRDRRSATASVRLTNSAPAGLPHSVTDRFDRAGAGISPGDSRLEVFYFATRGAVIGTVSVDGRPVPTTNGVEKGHPVAIVDLELRRGASRTITVRVTEPEPAGVPQVLRQPLVRALQVDLPTLPCR